MSMLKVIGGPKSAPVDQKIAIPHRRGRSKTFLSAWPDQNTTICVSCSIVHASWQLLKTD